MTPKIKFSHVYVKMEKNLQCKAPRTAILMEVFIANSEDLHPRFVEYDTIYWNKEENNWNYYKLPKGKVLILLLKSDEMVWMTIRRYAPAKHQYYLGKRWHEFIVDTGDEGVR